MQLKNTLSKSQARKNFIGATANEKYDTMFSSELQVKPNTPPAFLMLSGDDQFAGTIGSFLYAQALVDNKIPISLHVYPTGGHGWSFNDKFTYTDQVLTELETWLGKL